MLEGLLAGIVLMAAPPTNLPDDPMPIVRIDMPPGSAPPDGCSGMAWVEIVGDGQYRLKVLERDPGRWVEQQTTFDRRQLLGKLEPRRNDESQCGRVIVSAHQDRPYAEVLSTISMLRHNGFHRIALIDPTGWPPN